MARDNTDLFIFVSVMIWSTRSDCRVQQKQPFCMAITSSLWTTADWSIRLLSMLRAAMSLTMTAHLNSSSSCFVSRMCFRRVVLPEPRNPQSRVTGTRFSASGVWRKKWYVSPKNDKMHLWLSSSTHFWLSTFKNPRDILLAEVSSFSQQWPRP